MEAIKQLPQYPNRDRRDDCIFPSIDAIDGPITPLTGSGIRHAVKQVWQEVHGDRKTVSPTAIRKSVTTNTRLQNPSIRETLARHMPHQPTTADRYYDLAVARKSAFLIVNRMRESITVCMAFLCLIGYSSVLESSFVKYILLSSFLLADTSRRGGTGSLRRGRRQRVRKKGAGSLGRGRRQRVRKRRAGSLGRGRPPKHARRRGAGSLCTGRRQKRVTGSIRTCRPRHRGKKRKGAGSLLTGHQRTPGQYTTLKSKTLFATISFVGPNFSWIFLSLGQQGTVVPFSIILFLQSESSMLESPDSSSWRAEDSQDTSIDEKVGYSATSGVRVL
jgi:hypothetical protein